ncbi:ribonuclease H-like domain-containing protein [Tanacetum coccineum]
MIPQAVLMRSRLKTINNSWSRAAVNAAKPKAVHNAVKRNRFHDVKASACWVWKPKNRVIDHGRKITKIDQDPGISLVQHDAEIQGRHEHEPEFDFDAANIPVTTTGSKISTSSPEVKTNGDSIKDIVSETFVYIRRSAAKAKDKAVRLQAELDKEERQRISRAEGSSSSSDSVVDSCSKSCVKAYAAIKEQYDSLSLDYKKSQFNLVSYKAGLQSVEDRLVHYKKNEVVFEESINVLKLEVRLRDNALDEYKMKWEKAEKERDQLKQTLEKFQNSSKSLNDLLESQVIDKFKTGLGYSTATAVSPAVESFVNLTDKSGSDKGYHSVPPPLTGNLIPRIPDLTFMDEIVESENLDVTTVVTPCNVKTVENKVVSNTVKSNAVRMTNTSAPIIKDWNSDDESKIDYTVRPSTKKIKSIKTVREIDAPKQNKHHPRGNQRNWNNLMSQRLGSDFKMINKACFVCGSFNHLKKDCSKRMVKPVWNNARRVNHQNSTRMTHPNSKRNMIPQAVLMRSGLKTINIARSRAAVNAAKPKAVHNAVKRNSASIILKKIDYIDAQGRLKSVMAWGRHEHVPEFDFDAANVPVTTVGAEISTAIPKVKTAGDSIEDIAAETIVYIRRSATKAKDKGKIEESESAMTKTKRQQEQERLGFELAVRLQAELDKEEKKMISKAEGLIQELLQKIFIQDERSRR